MPQPKCETIMEAESFQEQSTIYNNSWLNGIWSTTQKKKSWGRNLERREINLFETKDKHFYKAYYDNESKVGYTEWVDYF